MALAEEIFGEILGDFLSEAKAVIKKLTILCELYLIWKFL